MDNTGSNVNPMMMMMGNNMQNPMMGNNMQNPMMDNNMQNQMMGNNMQNPMMNNNMQNQMMGNNMQNPMMGNNMTNQMMGNNMPNQMMGNNMPNQMQMMNFIQAAMIMNNLNNMSQNAEMLKKNINITTNQMNIDSQQIASPNDSLSVIFQAKDENNFTTVSITVQCLYGDKVSKLIDNYRIKSQDYDQTKKFIYNAQNLVPSKTCLESGLINNGFVYVIATKHIKGA